MDILGLQNTDLYTQASEKRLKSQVKQLETQAENPESEDKLHKACTEFESLLIKQMLDVMRKTVHKTGLTDGGYAEEIFEDMLYEKYAMRMAEHGNLGLAQKVYDQLSTYVEE
ncbi:MAG: rod-binding protein [Spirochaetales bacterium]|nr:rod-binding protein [Spirochaetales bacterium]